MVTCLLRSDGQPAWGGGEVTGQAALDGVVAEACAGARRKQRVVGLAGLLAEPAAQHRDGEPGERGGSFFAAFAQAGVPQLMGSS